MKLSYNQYHDFATTRCKLFNEVWDGPIKILPWHEAFLKPLIDGEFSQAYIFCPRQNGKSLIFCSYALAELLAHDGGEIYLLSSTVKQCEHNFQLIENFIDNDPDMSAMKRDKRLWVRNHKNTIEHRDSRGRLKCILKLLSSDKRCAGYSADLILCDELSEWGSTAREIWGKIQGSGAARPGSKIVVITTAQNTNVDNLGYELYKTACDIKANPKHPLKKIVLPVVYSIDELPDADWTKEKTWKACNPSYGVTVPAKFYRDQYALTLGNPRQEAVFKTQYLCSWRGSSEIWIPWNSWNAAQSNLTLDDFKGQPCVCSFDGAIKHDFCCFLLSFERDEQFYHFPIYFIPEERAPLKIKTDGIDLDTWESQGFVHYTPGSNINEQYITDTIANTLRDFDCEMLVIDEYGTDLIRQKLEDEHNVPCCMVKPAPALLSEACAYFERETLAGHLHYPHHPVLDWNLENVRVKTVGDYIYLDKRKQRKRIDGISCVLMSLWYRLEHGGLHQVLDTTGYVLE